MLANLVHCHSNRKRVLRGSIVLAAIILAISVWISLMSERDKIALFFGSGEIVPPSTRSILGVKLGMSEKEAINNLYRRGADGVSIKYEIAKSNISCLNSGKVGDHLMFYYDDTWREGAICFTMVNDKVSKIRWFYTSFAI